MNNKHRPNKSKIKSTTSRHRKDNQSKITSNVRIIGGRYKRQLIPFIDAQALRPSPDRLRETLFNWIQFDIHDATVLDLCAGSGVLGFESLSRGAQYAMFIELQPKQAELILQTAQKLKLNKNQFTIYIGDALRNIEKININFDFVFIDPPYDLELWIPLITKLIHYNIITAETILYVEDKRDLQITLKGLNVEYETLKRSKTGQIHASLIKLKL